MEEADSAVNLMDKLALDGLSLTTEQVVSIARDFSRVEVKGSAKRRVIASRRSIERLLNSGKVYYGINTGFGKLADTMISKSDLEKLQANLIRSHSVGIGSAFAEDEARAVMVVRLNSFLIGNSGVSYELIEQLLGFLNNRIYPMIPRYGSLGASGDLAPSAHLALCLMGEGYVIENAKQVPSANAIRRNHMTPLTLKAKEGLSIINGTQVMTALGCLLVHDALLAFGSLDVISAMSLEALGGSLAPFQARIQMIRPHEGQRDVAARIVRVLHGSSFTNSSDRVQDPYSLRCIPQVHGAFYESLSFASSIISTELNSVTDNPVVFPESDEIVSTGNFHGQVVSVALDVLCIALAEASVISERRIDKLLSGFNSHLPLFLTSSPGLNSGLMVTQYSAAALVARNREIAAPASLNSASVSAGQEDHASMGVNAALKSAEVLENTLRVLAIEAICASQAIDLLGRKRQGGGTTILRKEIRKLSSRVKEDRPLFEDVQAVAVALKAGLVQKCL
ncbi:MAG: histidine ammonia-lyase [Nitrososphaerales archaeon]